MWYETTYLGRSCYYASAARHSRSRCSGLKDVWNKDNSNIIVGKLVFIFNMVVLVWIDDEIVCLFCGMAMTTITHFFPSNMNVINDSLSNDKNETMDKPAVPNKQLYSMPLWAHSESDIGKMSISKWANRIAKMYKHTHTHATECGEAKENISFSISLCRY